MMFAKVKSDMKGRSNQFQVASKLIADFREEMDHEERSLDVDTQLAVDKRRSLRLVS